MRVARVYTNATCNQCCGFCHTRRSHEDRRLVAPAAVRARIDADVTAGGELVLTGGEPTMRRDLPALVAHGKRRGATRVILETNAVLITPALARALATAGLDLARVHLPAWGERCDAITRDPGGFVATLRGARALADAGVALEATAPVVAATVEDLPALPEAIAGAGLGIKALVLGVPRQAPDPSALCSFADAARVIAEVEVRARAVGLALRLEPDALVPPCMFEKPGRVAHLYSLSRGGEARPGFRPLAGCERCVAARQCPGFPEEALARDPTLAARPIAEDRIRRRLSVISTVEEQIARELYQDDIYRAPGEPAIHGRIVRVNFHCNQACRFCFVSTHLPPAEEEAVRAAIRGIATRGGALILSGGEPTLNPKLIDYVRLGKREGACRIELQTNAIRLGEPGRAAALKEAGVDDAFISLHGSTAAISDAVTSAPGTFVKTVVGIDEVVRAGIRARVNFVLCRANYRDFPAYVDMVASRWPTVTLVVSFVASSTDVVPRTEDLQPRYADVLPHLAEGLRRARAQGLSVTGFDSMCGIPLCLVPQDVSEFFTLAALPEGFDKGEFVKADACARCSLAPRCFGIRRGYVELHGADELRPVDASA